MFCCIFWSVGSNRKYSRVTDDITCLTGMSQILQISVSATRLPRIFVLKGTEAQLSEISSTLPRIHQRVLLRSFLCSVFLTFYSIVYQGGINHFTGSKPALLVRLKWVIPLSAVPSAHTHMNRCLALSLLLGSLVPLPHLGG